jgi:GxxExxY protein
VSHEGTKTQFDVMEYKNLSVLEEQIGKALVSASFKVHKELGPGLLERVYEVCITHELKKHGYEVRRQVEVPIKYDGIEFCEGFRLDLLINDLVIAELKAVESINPFWKAQLLSHLRLTKLNLGYLINFNVSVMKEGIQRFRI